MCSNNPGSMIPYGLKVPNLSPYMPLGTALTQLPLDFHRAQLYDYNARLQYGIRSHPTSLGLNPYTHAMDTLGHPYVFKQDLRARYIHEEPKPSHSYIGLIAMAILNSKEKKLVLSDIYQWILDNYPYFRTRGPGWRNSIRHNLSLNDCFIKAGRSANGKGHYWAIHPANIEDFNKGDFRRRRAQRRVRKHMGLSVPDDEDSPSPSPTSAAPIPKWSDSAPVVGIDETKESADNVDTTSPGSFSPVDGDSSPIAVTRETKSCSPVTTSDTPCVKKRLFDMESLLAPETKRRSCTSFTKDGFSRTVDMSSDRIANNSNLNNSQISPGKGPDVRDFTDKIIGKCEPQNAIISIANSQRLSELHNVGLLSAAESLKASAEQIGLHSKLSGCGGGEMLTPKAETGYVSAFHSMLPSTWGTLSSYAYPIMGGSHYSITVPVTTFSSPAKKWPQGFNDITHHRRHSPEKEVQVDV
ncbi:hypothetical protein Ahia01_000166000 [Argonauta hians]